MRMRLRFPKLYLAWCVLRGDPCVVGPGLNGQRYVEEKRPAEEGVHEKLREARVTVAELSSQNTTLFNQLVSHRERAERLERVRKDLLEERDALVWKFEARLTERDRRTQEECAHLANALHDICQSYEQKGWHEFAIYSRNTACRALRQWVRS